ncbi:unnamed protein product [Medioppia subpectinata]|uniref:Uncharacterized protein n=1 Tax=Medioppia subpectinata TaxID=1979941 RepID=A0A7R9PSX4_9ACAR|nr:unnamed protein product [Medioppia subpectinata]CAG2100079.1 unnamed protein product [Medioppia subpectinata]
MRHESDAFLDAFALKNIFLDTNYSTLKTGFSSHVSAAAHELDVDLITTSELRIAATLSSTTTARPKTSPYHSIYGTSGQCSTLTTGASYGSKSNRKSKKTHFTEMAKCMLEILDDLQVPQHHTGGHKADIYKRSASLSASTRLQTSILSTQSETDSIDLLMEELSSVGDTSDLSDISSISYRTVPEQHIYEEILYDCLESQQRLPPTDSPLYARYIPSHRRAMAATTTTGAHLNNKFAHSSVGSIRVDAPIHQSHIRHVGSWGRTRDKPKQRSNLYTIFADESERRNISRSLEREFCKSRKGVDIMVGPNGRNNHHQTIIGVDNYDYLTI